jgi:hypothetical protein
MKRLLIIAYLLIAAVPALADDKSWKPIDQVKAPVVEKDADAEVIFWDVLVDIGSFWLALNLSGQSHWLTLANTMCE